MPHLHSNKHHPVPLPLPPSLSFSLLFKVLWKLWLTSCTKLLRRLRKRGQKAHGMYWTMNECVNRSLKPPKLDVIINVVLCYFYIHTRTFWSIKTGRRRIPARRVFQQICILRQQQKNKWGGSAACHQQPNKQEVKSQDGQEGYSFSSTCSRRPTNSPLQPGSSTSFVSHVIINHNLFHLLCSNYFCHYVILMLLEFHGCKICHCGINIHFSK